MWIMQKYTAVSIATALALLLLTCSVAAETPAAQELTKAKAAVMAADYRANLDELARLHDELAKWPQEREMAYLAHYWSGFASWRIAINGANHKMKPEDLAKNLRNAASELYTSIRLKDDFADSWVAASMVNAWMSTFTATTDPLATTERIDLSKLLFTRANALEPTNPRVLWAKGGYTMYRAMSSGGSVDPAIEVYKQMLKETERRGVDASSPLPDWGKPEALMSLAWAHMSAKPAALDTAHDEAQAALKAAPEWSYVRDNLLPQIEGLRAKKE